MPNPIKARPIAGFTLMELIVILAIIGILSAMAIPKMFTLSKDTRIADVNGMAAAVGDAEALARSICYIRAGCNISGGMTLGFNGNYFAMYNGYPDAGDLVPAAGEIDTWVNYSGYTIVLAPDTDTNFELTNSPDPTNCKVTYTEATSFGVLPIITVTTTGC